MSSEYAFRRLPKGSERSQMLSIRTLVLLSLVVETLILITGLALKRYEKREAFVFLVIQPLLWLQCLGIMRMTLKTFLFAWLPVILFASWQFYLVWRKSNGSRTPR